jgi:hypothetical protein
MVTRPAGSCIGWLSGLAASGNRASPDRTLAGIQRSVRSGSQWISRWVKTPPCCSSRKARPCSALMGMAAQDLRAPCALSGVRDQGPTTVTVNRPADRSVRVTALRLHGRVAGLRTSGPARTSPATRKTGKCRSPPVTGRRANPLPRRQPRNQRGLSCLTSKLFFCPRLRRRLSHSRSLH